MVYQYGDAQLFEQINAWKIMTCLLKKHCNYNKFNRLSVAKPLCVSLFKKLPFCASTCRTRAANLYITSLVLHVHFFNELSELGEMASIHIGVTCVSDVYFSIAAEFNTSPKSVLVCSQKYIICILSHN